MNPRFSVSAVDPSELQRIRRRGVDDHGNPLNPTAASGRGEPLRCCLRPARAGESITLISYAPLEGPSVWREVGPIFIHTADCPGYTTADELPPELAHGPRVLRTYRADGAMNYDHNTLINSEIRLDATIEELLNHDDVETVHVRTVTPQCFLYAVSGTDCGQPGQLTVGV